MFVATGDEQSIVRRFNCDPPSASHILSMPFHSLRACTNSAKTSSNFLLLLLLLVFLLILPVSTILLVISLLLFLSLPRENHRQTDNSHFKVSYTFSIISYSYHA